MDAITYVRQLAKSDEYQNLYILAKEIGSIKILDNCNDFSYIQNIFFRYLNFYYTIYSDISIGDVGEVVLESDLYSDAYIMWKNDNDRKQYKENKKEVKKEDMNSLNTSTWIFKSKNASNKVT